MYGTVCGDGVDGGLDDGCFGDDDEGAGGDCCFVGDDSDVGNGRGDCVGGGDVVGGDYGGDG